MENRLIRNIHSKPTQKVGFVVKTHGFKGAVKINVDSDEIFNLIIENGFLLLLREGNWVPYEIESFNIENYSIKLKDINNENEALIIANSEIHLHKSILPKNDNTLYFDFIGYEIYNQDFKKLGIIKDWIEMPMHDLLEVAVENKNILVPIHEQLIIEVDELNKKITLEIHEGISDL